MEEQVKDLAKWLGRLAGNAVVFLKTGESKVLL